MIRFYPSRLPGEPLETHHHGTTTLEAWLLANVKCYQRREVPPIEIDVDGQPVAPNAWAVTAIKAGSDVRIYPNPQDLATAWTVVKIAVAVVSVYMSLTAKPPSMKQPAQGRAQDLSTATANTAQLGNPIREVFGECRVYPDYLTEPVARFDKKDDQNPNGNEIYRSSLFVCVGAGNFNIAAEQMQIGKTPIIAWGNADEQVTIYPPGADVSQDWRSECWYNSKEVGATNSGAGLDFSGTQDLDEDIGNLSITVSGVSVSVNQTDEEKDGEVGMPSAWVQGSVVTLRVPINFDTTRENDFVVFHGDGVTEASIPAGQPVTYTEPGKDPLNLVVNEFTPFQPASNGIGGSPAEIRGQEAITVLDWSGADTTFTIILDNQAITVHLNRSFPSVDAAALAISQQLQPYGLAARADLKIDAPDLGGLFGGGSNNSSNNQNNGGQSNGNQNSNSSSNSSSDSDDSEPPDLGGIGQAIHIYEVLPYTGKRIDIANPPWGLFGKKKQPQVIQGVKAVGQHPDIPARMSLKYPTGQSFDSAATPQQRASIVWGDGDYKITGVDGQSITVDRLDAAGNLDRSWPGFSARDVSDYEMSGITPSDRWLGPFMACPERETTQVMEFDFSFPSGLIYYNKKGKAKNAFRDIYVQWREVGGDWPSVSVDEMQGGSRGEGWVHFGTYNERNPNGLGFTERLELDKAARYEVRAKASHDGGAQVRDQVYWLGFRSLMPYRPKSYEGVTCIGVTIRAGAKLAAQSDRQFNVLAQRVYDNGAPRLVSSAVKHILAGVGLAPGDIDTATLGALERDYWTPRGNHFDYVAADDSASALDVLTMALGAGLGYPIMQGGLVSAGIEGAKPWAGAITPHQTLEPLQTSVTLPSDDDIDAVDVKYTDAVSWAEETVECRLSEDTPRKVETITAEGVTDKTQAFRIGMRHLLKQRYQRLTHSVKVWSDVLVYQYGDRLVLVDDIPGSQTLTAIVMGMEDAPAGIEVTNQDLSRIMHSAGGPSYSPVYRLLTLDSDLDLSGIESPLVILKDQEGQAFLAQPFQQLSARTILINTRQTMTGDGYGTFDPDLSGAIEGPLAIFCNSTRIGYQAIVSNIEPNEDRTATLTAVEYRDELYAFDEANYEKPAKISWKDGIRPGNTWDRQSSKGRRAPTRAVTSSDSSDNWQAGLNDDGTWDRDSSNRNDKT